VQCSSKEQSQLGASLQVNQEKKWAEFTLLPPMDPLFLAYHCQTQWDSKKNRMFSLSQTSEEK
jgi:hypothetical protein